MRFHIGADHLSRGKDGRRDTLLQRARRGAQPVDIADAPSDCRMVFHWCQRRVERLAYWTGGLAIALLSTLTVADTMTQILGAAGTCALAYCAFGIARRARHYGPVLAIDTRGITDRRVLERTLLWHEIQAIEPIDLDRGQVVELYLRAPHRALGSSTLRARFSAALQSGYGLPSVTLNLWLIDATPRDVLAAVARFEPRLASRMKNPRQAT